MSQAIDASLATLLTVSVKAALLALATATLLAALRIRNRNVHHRAWCGVLAAMLGLPLLSAVLPTFALPHQLAALWPLATEGRMPSGAAENIASREAAIHAAVAAAARLGDADAGSFDPGEQAPEDATQRDEQRAARETVAAGSAGVPWLTWTAAVFAVYACGVLLLVCRFALGVWAARCLNTHCCPLKLRRFAGARVYECDAVRVPLTLGFLRPRILLPSDWRTWSGALLASVLRHEQAHVDRRDPLWTALAEINRCLYWFHPLAWLLRRKLATLAETICDDYAVAQLGDRRRYAHHLLEIAGRMTAAPRRVAADAIFMARSSQVESRIDAILDDARPLARRLRPREAFALIIVTASALAVVTCLRAERTLAQQPQQRPADGQSAAAAQASPADPADGAAASTGPSATAVDRYGDPLPPGATTRLGSLRYRHPGFAWKRIAFLPDNKSFAVGGASQQVRLWDARSGRLLREIDHGPGQLVAFCVSPVGGEIATLVMTPPRDRRDFGVELVVWNATTWAAVRRAEWDRSIGPPPQQIAYSPDGGRIAMVFGDGTLRLWDVVSGEETVRPSPFRDQVESLEFSPNGEWLATAGRQGVLLWNVAANEEPEQLADLPQGAGVVRFSPDGSLLAVGGYDQAVARLYNVASRQMILAIEGPNRAYSREGMCFSADGRQLIVPSSTNVVDFFDVITAQRVRRLEAEAIMPCGVAVSPDGRLLASIGRSAAMNVWDLPSGERISDPSSGHLAGVYGVAWTPDDELVATASMDGTIRMWNAATGEQRHMLDHEGWPAAMAVAPGGEALLSCGLDDSLRLWDLASGDQLLKLPGHGNSGGPQSFEVAFSPDGSQLYSFGSDLRLNSYDRKTGRRLAQRNIRPSGVTIEVAADGRPDVHPDPFGASGAGAFSLDQVQFTPDASLLLLGDRNTGKIHTFDVATGREVDVMATDEPWQEFLVSPDGKLLATFEQPARTAAPTATIVRPPTTLRLRDLASKEVLREVTLPGSYAHRAAFSSDGTSIALAQVVAKSAEAGRSWSVAVLNVETLEQVASIEIQPNVLHKLAFSHDGSRLATSRDDSTTLIWDFDQLRTSAGAP